MKSSKFLISVIILLVIPLLIAAQEPNWLMRLKQMEWMKKVSKIKLLKTTRAEAEQILGKPTLSGDEKIAFIRYYDVEEGRIIITYTTRECISKNGKIDKDVVKMLGFRPKQKILFSSLKIPVRKFKKSVEDDAPSINFYEDKKNGVLFNVQFKELFSIRFSPSEREKFDCSD